MAHEIDLGKVTGENGITPHIGENNNWFIGDIDTNVNATGPKGDTGHQDGTAVFWSTANLMRGEDGNIIVEYVSLKDRGGSSPNKDLVRVNDIIVSSVYGSTAPVTDTECWAVYVTQVNDANVVCSPFSSAGFQKKSYRHRLAFVCNDVTVANYEYIDCLPDAINTENFISRLGLVAGDSIGASGFTDDGYIMCMVTQITVSASNSLIAKGIKFDGSEPDTLNIAEYYELTPLSVTDTPTEV